MDEPVGDLNSRIVLSQVQGDHQRGSDVHEEPEYDIEEGHCRHLAGDHQRARASEHDEANRVEETHGVGQDDLVDDRRYSEREKCGRALADLVVAEAPEVDVYVLEKPLVDHDVPLTIVLPQLNAGPPVQLESPEGYLILEFKDIIYIKFY